VSYYLERVQRGVDYIEAHLDDEIALESVARHAGISQWHFQRIFKALTGETLKGYIRSRRLAGSLDRLLTTKMRVLDIALLAGFDSQESFARVFKKTFGITPMAYRRLGKKNAFLRKAQIDAEYLKHVNENVSLVPEIGRRPAMSLVGVRTELYGVDSEKNNIGAKLPPLWGAFIARMAEIDRRIHGSAYGVVQQLASDGEMLEYHAAVPVDQLGLIPKGMVALELPAATYACFRHRGLPEQMDHTVNYIYSTWLSQSEHRHSYGADLEIYGPEYRPGSAESVTYYAIPIA
jgi:AraC-like DNA-binding protein/predicted transcriptional regulator YdeE